MLLIYFCTVFTAVPSEVPSPTGRGEPQRAHSDLWFEVSGAHITCEEEEGEDEEE